MNQFSAMSVMPMSDNLFNRMEWEMVSNAAVRSRRMSMESEPESAASKRSLVILISADSVL